MSLPQIMASVRWRCLAAVVAMVALFWAFAAAAGELNIVFTTDLHGDINQLTELGKAIRAVPEPAVRIDVGDTTQGNFYASLEDARPLFAALNSLRYDCWVPGNHDFDAGVAPLARRIHYFSGTTLGADWHSIELPHRDWVLIERGDFRCAVVGLGEYRQPSRMMPDSNIDFISHTEALDRTMPEVLAARPDIVVLARHDGPFSGPTPLAALLRRHPEIDVVLGGHTHQDNPGERVGRALYVQCADRARAAGVVRAVFDDRSKRLIRVESRLLRPTPNDIDSELAALRDSLRKSSAARRAIGRVPENLATPENGDFSSALAQFSAQAIRQAAGTLYAIATTQRGKFAPRSSRLTAFELFCLFPYDNPIAVIDLKRGEIQAAMNELSRFKNTLAVFSGPLPDIEPVGGSAEKIPHSSELLSVAMPEYLLLSAPALRRAVEERRFRRLGITERQCAERRIVSLTAK